MSGKEVLQNVARLEKRIDHILGKADFVLAHPIEQSLHDMGDLRQVLEPERAGAPLDGMRSAEYRIQILGIGIVEIDIQQQLFEVA